MSYNSTDEISSASPKVLEVMDKSPQPQDQQSIFLENNVQDLISELSLENIDQRLKTLQKLDQKISEAVDALETLNINLQIIDYKLYYANYEFKEKIDQIKEKRQMFLESPKDHSKLSLLLNDIDQKLLDLQNYDDEQKRYLNQLKITNQEEIEQLILQLDNDTSTLNKNFQQYESILDAAKSCSQLFSFSEDSVIKKDKLQNHLKDYLKYRIAGWKLESSEIQLTDTLNSIGLKFTPSNRLLTQDGNLLSFEEVQQKGYFKNLGDTALQKLKKFLESQEHIDNMDTEKKSHPTSSKSLNKSQFASEDVKYLKKHVGKALTLAVAEIVTRQPRDPIHYLGHYLFKYRYNQDLDRMEKNEVEELTKKRESFVKKRWDKFVQDEAKNAIVDMIIKAEELAFKNDLQRIEEEQRLTAEEENT